MTTTDDKLAEKFAFILRVLKNTECLPKPDWKTIMAEEGFSRPDKPRDKFRNIIKGMGFDYVNDQIVDPKDSTSAGGGGEAEGGTSGAAKEKTKDGATMASTPDSKKRKSPTKRAAKGESAKKAKTSAPSNKGEVEVGDKES